jgi:hypothetical protein
MRFCVVDEGTPCTCDVCIELPALPSCAEGDILCYKRYIEAAVKRASRLMYISPQVVDLQVKAKALDTILPKLHRDVPVKAAFTPWGPILYAAKDGVRIPHYIPKLTVRMKNKEFDEFQPLGTIADAINNMLEVFGEFPQLFQILATMYISAVIESNVPIFIQYATKEDSIVMVEMQVYEGTLTFNLGLRSAALKITCYTGRYGDSITLVGASFSRAELVDAIDRALCPSRNYKDENCLYDELTSAASTMSSVIANTVGQEVLHFVHVRALSTEFTTYFGKHRIEATGTYAVNQAAVPVDLRSVIAAAAAAAKNLFKPLHIAVDVTPSVLQWNCEK